MLMQYALVCLRIAAKYEGHDYQNMVGVTSVMTILGFLDYQCEIEDLVQTELTILMDCLDFIVPRPTQISMAKLILYMADPSFNFEPLIEKLIPIQQYALLDSDIQLINFKNGQQNYTLFSLTIAGIYLSL